MGHKWMLWSLSDFHSWYIILLCLTNILLLLYYLRYIYSLDTMTNYQRRFIDTKVLCSLINRVYLWKIQKSDGITKLFREHSHINYFWTEMYSDSAMMLNLVNIFQYTTESMSDWGSLESNIFEVKPSPKYQKKHSCQVCNEKQSLKINRKKMQKKSPNQVGLVAGKF